MRYLKRQNGSTIIFVLVLGSFMAVTLTWTMNYIVVERGMQEARKSRAGFENFLQALRGDLQDGYQCTRFLGGQPFPKFSNVAIGNDEVDIQIRNYRWRGVDGTLQEFPIIRGDNPATAGYEGTTIRDIGIQVHRLTIKRGLITPGSLPPLRPSGTTDQEKWGQDRWYRPVLHSGAPIIFNATNPNFKMYGDLRNTLNAVTGLNAGTVPRGIRNTAPTDISIFGMIFAAEIIIEPVKPDSQTLGSGIANKLFFGPRDDTKPLNRIQLYVKATLATRFDGTVEPVILGCYGPNTSAQLCDQTGGNFMTLPILDGKTGNPIADGGTGFGRFYCHPASCPPPRKIPVPLPAGIPSAIFGDPEKAECESPGGQPSPFVAEPLGNFTPGSYMCNWCNPNPEDPDPGQSLGPQYSQIKPALAAPNPPKNLPNVFGGSAGPYF